MVSTMVVDCAMLYGEKTLVAEFSDSLGPSATAFDFVGPFGNWIDC